jgi:hypothetical protein
MAFTVSVKGVPGRDGSEYWMEDMVPWGAASLCNDPRFRLAPVDETGTYRDYVAVLTTREALEINAGCQNSGLPHWDEKTARLQDLLTHKTPSGLVVICIYEWESGLSD